MNFYGFDDITPSYISISPTNLGLGGGTGISGGSIEVETPPSTISFTLIDDVAGDQTGDLVNFVRHFKIDKDDVKSFLFDTDLTGANYTVLGTPRPSTEIGEGGKTGVSKIVLSGANVWNPTADMLSITVLPITIADINNPPTFTDNDNLTSPLRSGFGFEIPLNPTTESFKIDNIAITAFAGDVIDLYITKLTS